MEKEVMKKASNHPALLLLLFYYLFLPPASGWGFWAHKRINKYACFTLPAPLFSFYKKHIEFISEQAIAPDRRRYADPDEAPRHYINLDYYQSKSGDSIPFLWKDAVALYTEDTLKVNGIVPWHINTMLFRLTEAFRAHDAERILSLSAAIGHYIADAHVPLHCTENYNGQKTNQQGIHALWESRLPELFAMNYDHFTGMAYYIEHPQQEAWKIVRSSYAAHDSVLVIERELNSRFDTDKKYAYEQRGNTNMKVYSREYASAYHTILNGMVERRFREAILYTGSFWYTAWVNAGSPDMKTIDKKGAINYSKLPDTEEVHMLKDTLNPAGHED